MGLLVVLLHPHRLAVRVQDLLVLSLWIVPQVVLPYETIEAISLPLETGTILTSSTSLQAAKKGKLFDVTLVPMIGKLAAVVAAPNVAAGRVALV